MCQVLGVFRVAGIILMLMYMYNRQALKVPIIANGNVQTVADVERCIVETGCDAVMVAGE